MMRRIYDQTYPGIDSVAIVRDQTLLLYEQVRRNLDEYDSWSGNEDFKRHVMHSTSKSVTSALIGIAIGCWLDAKFGGHISWCLTFLFVGVVVGAAIAWNWLKKEGHVE